MATTEKIEELLISNTNSKKRINIILKDTNSNIIYAETIEYKEKKHKTLIDIENYISDKFDYKYTVYGKYDDATQSNYICYDAKMNRDFINWAKDFNSINIEDAFKGQADNSITIVLFNVPSGMGSTGGHNLLKLPGLIKILVWLTKYFRIAKKPYKKLYEKYHRGKEFIDRTILLKKTWKCGFISRDEFEFKKTIEKRIMKKLGYKKKEAEWIKVCETYAK